MNVLNKDTRAPIHLATTLENDAIIKAVRPFGQATDTHIGADDDERSSNKKAVKPENTRNAKFAARVEDEKI